MFLGFAGVDSAPPSEFLIFSFGTTDTLNGEYSFDAESAATVMRNATEYGNHLTIDYEHQAIQSPPVRAPAAGRYQLELRADGLWAVNVKWTADAAKHLSAKEYLYYSPAFLKDSDGKPFRLINIGLTNLPATRNMTSLVAAKLEKQEPEMKTVLLALNLRESATEADALSAVTSLRLHCDELAKLTDRATLGEAIATVQGWKIAAAEVVALRASMEQQKAAAEATQFDTELAAAKVAALLAPSDEHKRNRAALAFKGKPDAITSLRSFLSALDPLVGSAAIAAVREPAAVLQTGVTDEEKRIAKKFNIPIEEVQKNKARLIALRALPDDDDDNEDEDAA